MGFVEGFLTLILSYLGIDIHGYYTQLLKIKKEKERGGGGRGGGGEPYRVYI